MNKAVNLKIKVEISTRVEPNNKAKLLLSAFETALNRYLPDDFSVADTTFTPYDFHAYAIEVDEERQRYPDSRCTEKG